MGHLLNGFVNEETKMSLQIVIAESNETVQVNNVYYHLGYRPETGELYYRKNNNPTWLHNSKLPSAHRQILKQMRIQFKVRPFVLAAPKQEEVREDRAALLARMAEEKRLAVWTPEELNGVVWQASATGATPMQSRR